MLNSNDERNFAVLQQINDSCVFQIVIGLHHFKGST